MAVITTGFEINSENLNNILNELKARFDFNNIDKVRANRIKELINRYGYLPFPHIKALKELTPAETLVALEQKMKLNKTYNEAGFAFDASSVSAVKRAGFQDASWMQKEQHNIKLVNLAGLGNGNESKEPGKFIDWLKQVVTLPSGLPEEGIMATTAYLIPFHPREFGCAYIPKHSGVSQGLKDENINLSAKDQVRVFIALTQLAGHPVIYDILPQTGRFSKIILSNPYAARWFNINQLIDLNEEEKRTQSELMMTKEKQELLCQKAKTIINEALGKLANEDIVEEDISDEQHGEIIGKLINEGLWPAPGGAWNSAGTPIFLKMSEDGSYPMFNHYDHQGIDVTEFANLDCQTPYYFVYLENGKYNEKVIEFFINLMKKLQKEYNFDGFRVDHIDHIADVVSEKNLVPISYRAPRTVLMRLNVEMKSETPYFASLAEYMLWDDLFLEYHRDMGFDVLWGNDIVSQYQKDVSRIIDDNKQIEDYNKAHGIPRNLSILKAYNNQDGEFRAINQYPGQLGEKGALFKWFKFKFLPGGELANRPVLFIDGDESFTKIGIEAAIGAEESMPREENYDFFDKFDAIDRLAKQNEQVRSGKAILHKVNKQTGVASWMIEKQGVPEKIMVIANEKPPKATVRDDNGEWIEIQNKSAKSVEIWLPAGHKAVAEFIFNTESKKYEEVAKVGSLDNSLFRFNSLEPSEFHVYKLQKIG